MNTTTTIKAQLAELFRRAGAAAELAGSNDEDGGTCNLDTPAFRVERMRKATIERAAQAAGLTVTEFDWFGGRRWFWLHTPTFGQGNRRARMAQAAAHVLREAEGDIPGFRASLYCQMD